MQETADKDTASDTTTNTVTNATIPAELAGLRAVTSLDDILVLGVISDTDTTALKVIAKNIDAKKYEKIRYIASSGEQFCMWNVRMLDIRYGSSSYEWYVAPQQMRSSPLGIIRQSIVLKLRKIWINT